MSCVVKYDHGEEIWIEKYEELSLRENNLARELKAWQAAVDKISPALEYIEHRLTDSYDSPHHLLGNMNRSVCLLHVVLSEHCKYVLTDDDVACPNLL